MRILKNSIQIWQSFGGQSIIVTRIRIMMGKSVQVKIVFQPAVYKVMKSLNLTKSNFLLGGTGMFYFHFLWNTLTRKTLWTKSASYFCTNLADKTN